MAKRNFVITQKPRSPNIQFREYREEIRKDLKKVADSHIKSREQITGNWSEASKPQFKATVIVTIPLIGIRVTVKEADRKRPIWKWLSVTGTKAHPIRPKRSNPSGLLRFPWGGPGSYQPKTGPNPARFGGPGTVKNAVIRFFRFVNHPGFLPRKFDEVINRDLEPEFVKALKVGGRRGLRRAKKAK